MALYSLATNDFLGFKVILNSKLYLTSSEKSMMDFFW